METGAMQAARTGSNSVGDRGFENTSSGVSWAAIIAGGVASASLALILLTLGVGLGLSSVSPWSNAGISATAIGASAIFWLILTHVIASGMGGYLAGRLRTKWSGIHTDEVYFRDTAHGLLAWAAATIVAAALLGSVMTSIVAAGVEAAASTASTVAGIAANSAAQPQRTNNVLDYFSDSLFRSDRPATDGSDTTARGEAGRIFATALERGGLDPADKAYLGKAVAARTGLADFEAAKRVDETFSRLRADRASAEAAAKQAGDAMRKAAAHSALWMFIALLCGAFAASYAAIWGGRRRDHVTVTVRSHNPAPTLQ